MSEEYIKDFMKDKVCPRCLEKIRKDDPKFIDCALRYYNDQNMCHKANRLRR